MGHPKLSLSNPWTIIIVVIKNVAEARGRKFGTRESKLTLGGPNTAPQIMCRDL